MKKIFLLFFLFVSFWVNAQYVITDGSSVLADDNGNPITYDVPSPSFQPTDIAGCKLWLDAGQGITLNGSNVSGWADQSGNGNDATQGAAISQPLLVDNALNGYPVIRFDGSNDILYNTSFNLNQPNTIFIVYKWLGDGVGAVIFNDWNNNITSWRGGAGGYTINYYAGLVVSSLNIGTSNVFNSYTVTFNGANSKSWNNGGAFYDGNAGTNAWSGFSLCGASAGYNGNYEIPEVIIYDTTLSDIERQQVEQYLNLKYAIY